MMTLAYFAVFVAVTLLTYQFFETEEERRVRQALNPGATPRRTSLLVYRLAAPFVRQIAPLLSRLPISAMREATRKRLVSAGLQSVMEPDEFVAFRVVLAAGVFGLAFLLGLRPLILAGLLGGAAWVFPGFWLSSVISRRRAEIFQELPYHIDLLTLSVEAGLDFQIALQRVVAKSDPSALRDEFRLMLQEIKMGKSRADGLRSLATRVDVQDITSFAAVLIQADQLGASIGGVLRAQADKMRTERFQRAEKAGARSATKILIPTMLFIVPALMLIVFGAFFLSFFQVSSGMLQGGL